MSDVWSAFPDAAPSGAGPGADPWAVFPDAGGKGDRLPMAPGAVLHAMPADTVQGFGPPPSVGGDIAASAGSRLAAGALDIPGMFGDLASFADTAGSAAAQGVLSLFGVSPEKRQATKTAADAYGRPLQFLPGSEDVKKAVGFEAYQPQTAAGKIFDKYVGTGLEMAPGVLVGGGVSGLKRAGGSVLRYAIAPAAASEVAGDVTKGTPLEPVARLGAALVTGGVAGAKRGRVAAPTVEELHASGRQAYKDMEAAGVVMKPNSYDAAVNKIMQEAKIRGLDADLHKGAAATLRRLMADKGTPKQYEELDRLHQLAVKNARSIDPREADMGDFVAHKIDDMIEGLKPGDLQGGNPQQAWNYLTRARSDWRKMRSGRTIANIIQGAKDTLGANYTNAGMQTALRQAFNRYKWRTSEGAKQLRRDYERLPKEGQALVDQLIEGGNLENTLRTIGKFNLKSHFVQLLFAALGVTLNPGAIAVGGIAAAGSLAKGASARMAVRNAAKLGGIVRGGQRTPGRFGRSPNAIVYGAAAQRETDRSKQGGQ